VTKISNLIQSSARRRSLLLLAGGALVLGVVACSGDAPEPTAVPPAPTSAPAPTAEHTAAPDPIADDAMMDGHSDDLMMAQAEASVIIPLDALDGSGQSGVAILLDKGSTTEVVIDIGSGAADVPQPIHIHAGTCDALGDVAHALTNVVEGRSMTVIDDSISNVMRDGFAVNLHKSGDEIAVYTACGEIVAASMTALDGGDATKSEGSPVLSDISGFQLQTLSISVGDTVTWTNQDNAPHTVSHGLSPDVDSSPEFQSGNFSKDGTFSHTFDATGTFAYFCEVHPSMVGSVTVEPGPVPSGIADAGGDPGY
jgi:plastocyanin